MQVFITRTKGCFNLSLYFTEGSIYCSWREGVVILSHLIYSSLFYFLRSFLPARYLQESDYHFWERNWGTAVAADLAKLGLDYTSGFNNLKSYRTKLPKSGSEGTDQPTTTCMDWKHQPWELSSGRQSSLNSSWMKETQFPLHTEEDTCSHFEAPANVSISQIPNCAPSSKLGISLKKILN